MRLSGHVVLAFLALSPSVVAQPRPRPLVLNPLPLPGRFSNLLQGPGGTWLVEYGAWSEYGGARLSVLRRGNQWLSVPPGATFVWKNWLVIEGLFPLSSQDDEGKRSSSWDGGTLVVTQGTDDAFVRRVVLVDWRTGDRFEAPWDTLAPLPLGTGAVWLLLRCPQIVLADGGVEAVLELVAWAPRSGQTRRLGQPPGDPGLSCGSSAIAGSLRAVAGGALGRLVSDDGGERWVRIDATGHVTNDVSDAGFVRLSAAPVDGGSPRGSLRRLNEAFLDVGNAGFLQSVDGRPVLGQLRVGEAPTRLTPSMGGGVALHDGLLFTDEGVFLWPAGTPAPVGEPSP